LPSASKNGAGRGGQIGANYGGRIQWDGAFTIANVLAWVSSAVFFASLFLVPVFFERVENLSALATGEIVIGQGLAMAVGLAISGRLYNRWGPRALAVIGAMLVTASMFGFTRLTVTTTGADLQLWLILRGLGLGLFIQPLQTLAVSVVSREQMARATSLRNSTTTVVNAYLVPVMSGYLSEIESIAEAQSWTASANPKGAKDEENAINNKHQGPVMKETSHGWCIKYQIGL